jgi:hypothetical protein
MRRVVRRIPAKPSRGPMGTDPAPADGVSRQTNQDEDDICLDNDLGAEWTGNIECEESAKNKPKRGSGACKPGWPRPQSVI